MKSAMKWHAMPCLRWVGVGRGEGEVGVEWVEGRVKGLHVGVLCGCFLCLQKLEGKSQMTSFCCLEIHVVPSLAESGEAQSRVFMHSGVLERKGEVRSRDIGGEGKVSVCVYLCVYVCV